VLPDLENKGIFYIAVGISLLSCVPAELHVISFALPVPGRHLEFSTHPDVVLYIIRPTILFDAKDMRISVKFHIYSIFDVRFKCFRFPVRHIDFRLNSHRIVHRAMLLSAAVTSASSKIYAATLNLLPKVIQWSPSLSNFHLKISTPPSFPVT